LVAVLTASAATVSGALVPPAGLKTCTGVSLMRSLLSENVAVRPAAGAGPSSANVPVDVFGDPGAPPASDVGLSVMLATAGAFTARFIVLLIVPRVAVIAALAFAVRGTTVTRNVALDWLAGMRTVAGTAATLGLLDDN
jgi:hypothetical protein